MGHHSRPESIKMAINGLGWNCKPARGSQMNNNNNLSHRLDHKLLVRAVGGLWNNDDGRVGLILKVNTDRGNFVQICYLNRLFIETSEKISLENNLTEFIRIFNRVVLFYSYVCLGFLDRIILFQFNWLENIIPSNGIFPSLIGTYRGKSYCLMYREIRCDMGIMAYFVRRAYKTNHGTINIIQVEVCFSPFLQREE